MFSFLIKSIIQSVVEAHFQYYWRELNPIPSLVSLHQQALYYACNTERRNTERRVRIVPRQLRRVGVLDHNKTTGKKKANLFQYLPCYDLYNAPKHNPRVGEQRRDYLQSAERRYILSNNSVTQCNSTASTKTAIVQCTSYTVLLCIHTTIHVYLDALNFLVQMKLEKALQIGRKKEGSKKNVQSSRKQSHSKLY